MYEPIFGEWLFTLFSMTRSGMGQKLQGKLEYAKAAARAAYFADNDVKGLQAMNDAQRVATWAQLKGILKAAQNQERRQLMREFHEAYFATQEDLSQAARAKNQERSWDEQRRAVPEALASRTPGTIALAVGSQVGQGHLVSAVAHADGGDVAVDARVAKGMTLLEARFRLGFAYSARGLEIPTGLNAQRGKLHEDISENVKAAGAVLYVAFEGRNVKIEGDRMLSLDEAVKRAIMREFGYTREHVDGIDVDELLHSHLFMDMGSAVMFSKALDARGPLLFATEMFGLEGKEGRAAKTLLEVLNKIGEFQGYLTWGEVKNAINALKEG